MIREMTIDDYDGVYQLWTSIQGVGVSPDDTREGVEKYLRRNPTTCFVAEESGEIVGVILAGHDGRRGYIYHVAVVENKRGRGVGRELAASALAALKEKGIRKVGLMAFRDNALGNGFWAKQGFDERADLVYRNKEIE